MEITVQDVIDAIRKNGLPQAYGTYIKYADDDPDQKNPLAACAIGQAALNLKIGPIGLSLRLREVEFDREFTLRDYIIQLNDKRKLNFDKIANHLERKLSKDIREQVISEA